MVMNRGPYAQLCSGAGWHFFDPRPEDVRLEDLVAAICRLNRYGSHIREDLDWYVVGEHGVRCAWLVRDLGGTALECYGALHHDTHEGVPPGDVLGPFLRAMRSAEACAVLGLTPAAFEGLLEVERRAKRAVREALGLTDVFANATSAKLIKHADDVLLATERRDLMAPSDLDWGPLPEPLRERIAPWSPRMARAQFMATHNALRAAL